MISTSVILPKLGHESSEFMNISQLPPKVEVEVEQGGMRGGATYHQCEYQTVVTLSKWPNKCPLL